MDSSVETVRDSTSSGDAAWNLQELVAAAVSAAADAVSLADAALPVHPRDLLAQHQQPWGVQGRKGSPLIRG